MNSAQFFGSFCIAACMLGNGFGYKSSLPSPEGSPPGWVTTYLTTGNQQHLFEPGSAQFAPGGGSHPAQIQVDEKQVLQPIDGFGGAFTETTAQLIMSLPEPARTNLMYDLFSPTGIGITILRLVMGTSDYTPGPHRTYDDRPAGQTDPMLAYFSIELDKPAIILLVKQALQINPQLMVIASPWSAPAWMKTPQTLYGGSLNMIYCQVYANYFVRFVQAYATEGIPIAMVTVQNEPYNPMDPATALNYPTMHMDPLDQAAFVKNCLGPTFAAQQITTRILVWDHNWDRPDYPLAVLSDATARAYITGSAWHCYAGDPSQVDAVHNAYPDQAIYFTECSGSGSDTFAGNLTWGLHNVMIGTLRHWSQMALYWNLALDENHGPRNGGYCTDCRGLVTIGLAESVTATPEYYIVGHLSKFVAPGAHRIGSTQPNPDLESVAFQNPGGALVLVMLNQGNTSQTFDVQWRGQSFAYTLEAHSVATFNWSPVTVYLPIVKTGS